MIHLKMHASVRLFLSLRKKDLTELTLDLGDVARLSTKNHMKFSFIPNPTLPLSFRLLFKCGFQFNTIYFNFKFDNRDRTILIQLKVVHNQVQLNISAAAILYFPHTSICFHRKNSNFNWTNLLPLFSVLMKNYAKKIKETDREAMVVLCATWGLLGSSVWK